MKTISKLTGTEDRTQNVIALTGLLLIGVLITSFMVLASINGIKSF